MKTIKIFLASSEELADDRNAFGNLVRRLDKIYEKRGIRIELFEWEDYDAAYNDRRKQDEYNDMVRASDMFLALFHRIAGKFTIEEFDVATEEFRKRATPKVYAYCRDLQANEVESPELTDFKRRLFEEMGHYWSRYSNRDTMQLHFVMQLQLVETSGYDALRVENGEVTIDGIFVANMDNLPFAAKNEGYKKMKAELEALPMKIAKKRQRMEEHPDDKEYLQELQELQNRYNDLKDEYETHQQALFNTAKRIAEMQMEVVSSELGRAIQEFEAGHVEATNAILDGVRKKIKHHKEEAKRNHKILQQDIRVLLFQAKTLMLDVKIPIKERIERTLETYREADELALLCVLEPKEYACLLRDFGLFLYNNLFFNEALKIIERGCRISEQTYGLDSFHTAILYNSLGNVYAELNNNEQSLYYLNKALTICKTQKSISGLTIHICNNIAAVYDRMGCYPQSLDYLQMAIRICDYSYGTDHRIIAQTYRNTGNYYVRMREIQTAIDYHQKALALYMETPDINCREIADLYNCLGGDYRRLMNYSFALEYHQKALRIQQESLGEGHIEIAGTYSNIADAYCKSHNYSQALVFYKKAQSVYTLYLGIEHPEIAYIYHGIGDLYYFRKEYAMALEFYQKALTIQEKAGIQPNRIATIYNNIGNTYGGLHNYTLALEFYQKALKIDENIYDNNHPHIKICQENIKWAKTKIESQR